MRVFLAAALAVLLILMLGCGSSQTTTSVQGATTSAPSTISSTTSSTAAITSTSTTLPTTSSTARSTTTTAGQTTTTIKATTTTRASVTVSVAIQDFAFQPSSVTIAVGDRVVWTNQDQTAHTVTAADGSFGSAEIPPGGTFSHRFTRASTYGYQCAIHPSMTGMVTVR